MFIFKMITNFATFYQNHIVMNTKAFIKVTPKDGGRPVVLPEGNRAFYLSQGAKIETPTEAEIFAAFPEVEKAERKKIAEKNAEIARAKAQNALTELRNDRDKLKRENQSLREEAAKKDAEIARLEAEIEEIKSQADHEPENHEPASDPEKSEEAAPEKPKSRGGRRAKTN